MNNKKIMLILATVLAVTGKAIYAEEVPLTRSVFPGSPGAGFIVGSGGKLIGNLEMDNGSVRVNAETASSVTITGENVSIAYNVDDKERLHVTGTYSFTNGITLGDGDEITIEEKTVRMPIKVSAGAVARLIGAGSLGESVLIGDETGGATLEIDLTTVCDQPIVFGNEASLLKLQNDLTLGSGVTLATAGTHTEINPDTDEPIVDENEDVIHFDNVMGNVDTNGYVLKIGDGRVASGSEHFWSYNNEDEIEVETNSWEGSVSVITQGTTFSSSRGDTARIELQGDVDLRGLWQFSAPFSVISGNGHSLFSSPSDDIFDKSYTLEPLEENVLKISNARMRYRYSFSPEGRFLFSNVAISGREHVSIDPAVSYSDEEIESYSYTDYLYFEPYFIIQNGGISAVGSPDNEGLYGDVTWMRDMEHVISLNKKLSLNGLWTIGEDATMRIEGNGYGIDFSTEEGSEQRVGIDIAAEDATLHIVDATLTNISAGKLIDISGNLRFSNVTILSEDKNALTIKGASEDSGDAAILYSVWDEALAAAMKLDPWFTNVVTSLAESDSFNNFVTRVTASAYYTGHPSFLSQLSATSFFGVEILNAVSVVEPFSTIISALDASTSVDGFIDDLAFANGEDIRSVYYQIEKSAWYRDTLMENLKTDNYVPYRDSLVGSADARLAFIKSIVTESALPESIETVIEELQASHSSSDFIARITAIIDGDASSALYKLTQLSWYTNTLVAGLATHNNINEEDTKYEDYVATLIGSDDATAAFVAGVPYYQTLMDSLAASTSWRDFQACMVVNNGGSRTSNLYSVLTKNQANGLSWVEASLIPSLRDADGETYTAFVASLIGSDSLLLSFVANLELVGGRWFQVARTSVPSVFYSPYDIAHYLYPVSDDYEGFLYDKYLQLNRGGDFFNQDVLFSNGASLSLRDRVTLGASWRFYDNSSINGEGNVLDIAGGKMQFREGVENKLSDIVIYGFHGATNDLASSIYVANDSIIRCSNVTFVLTGDVTLNSGKWFFDSTCTFITGNYKVSVVAHPSFVANGSTRVTVDRCTLWYDTLGYPDSKNINPSFDTTTAAYGLTGHVRFTRDSAGVHGRIARVIGFEAGDYHFTNNDELSENLFLYQDSSGGYGVQIYFEQALTLDGKGRTIFFGDTRSADAAWLLSVAADGVSIKNAKLYGLRSEHISGGRLTFGDYTTIELTYDDSLNRDYYVSTANNSAAVILDLGGKKLDLNNRSIYVSGKLIVRNGTITGIGESNAQIRLDANSTVEYDNVRLEVTDDVSMESGRMVISGACTLAGNAPVEFKNNSTGQFGDGTFQMKPHSSLIVEDGITYYHSAGSDATLEIAQLYLLESFKLAETAKFVLIGGTLKTNQWQTGTYVDAVLTGWQTSYLLLAQGHLVADHTATMRGNFAFTPLLNIDIMPGASITIEEGTVNYVSIA